MFTILNRLRGTRGYFAWINGTIIGILAHLLTNNPYVAAMSGLGYVLGESFGWGAWVGTLSVHGKNTPEYITKEDEGVSNGIKFLASQIADPEKDWYKYSIVALAIRGIYYWLPVFAPLAYLYGIVPLIIGIILGLCFPVAAILGRKYRHLKIYKWTGGWEIQELIYGFFMDIAFIATLLYVLLR